MPDIALRGVPDNLHKELKAAASRNHRSLNGEILARLSDSVWHKPLDVQEFLDRIKQRRQSIGDLDLSEQNLRSMRDAGRP